MPLSPITSVRPGPVDERALVDRLGQTLVAAAAFALFVPALLLAVFSVVMIPLGLTGIGFALAHLVVPATERLVGVHRALSGRLLDTPIEPAYADTSGRGFFGRPLAWLRDKARWRDFAELCFSMSGGAIVSGLVPLLLLTPLVHLIIWLVVGGWAWTLLLLISWVVCPLVWWCVTPGLVRGRALAERGILGHTRVATLEHRVEQVEQTRSATLDHNAAEVRRIERDLHDGAQARIAAVGMNVGLAEKLLATDPEAAAELLREARETTLSALEDLRSVVRGIHPPVLADLGLAGAIEALALALPLPVTVSIALDRRLPAPVESAAYFAVAECLTNTVKHSGAARAYVRGTYDGALLRLVVGDDGRGGADPAGSGLTGVARRLAAFDGSVLVESPAGGPTAVTLALPCRT